MLAAGGGGACAREGRLQCGGLIDADRRDRLDFGVASVARCGGAGGSQAVAWCRVMVGCGLTCGRPLTPPVVRVVDVRFSRFCCDIGALHGKKVRPRA